MLKKFRIVKEKLYLYFKENEFFFFSYTLVVKIMQLFKPIREFLVEKNYYIDIYEDGIHIFHYVDILKLQAEEIVLQMDDFSLQLQGANFRVTRLENQEILITGVLDCLKMIR